MCFHLWVHTLEEYSMFQYTFMVHTLVFEMHVEALHNMYWSSLFWLKLDEFIMYGFHGYWPHCVF